MDLNEFLFFFNDSETTEIYTYGHTLSLHDALPISAEEENSAEPEPAEEKATSPQPEPEQAPPPAPADPPPPLPKTTPPIVTPSERPRPPANPDRKSTRLNSSH